MIHTISSILMICLVGSTMRKRKQISKKMLALLKQLNDRLNEINDGSFVVEDLETERVKNFNKLSKKIVILLNWYLITGHIITLFRI